MQVITGKYRARKLVSVNSSSTRPTLARVKESIFNLIQGEISGRVVLDLFAGSGAFGVECISRGAKKVYFVDSSAEAAAVIKTNTKNMTEPFEILNLDCSVALQRFCDSKIKFDLIFLDPPYDSGLAIKSLQFFAKSGLLSQDGLIVVEHEYKNDLQNLPDCYIIEKSRKYGIAYVDTLRQKVK